MPRLQLILLAIAILGSSGVPALFCARRALGGQRIAAMLMLLGSALGVTGAAWALADPTPVIWALPGAPALGQLTIGLDALSAFFLMPVFVVPALGALYGLGYWRQAAHPTNGRRLGLAYGMLAAAMALVVIARNGVLFLIAWEIMALAAFFASTAEDREPDVRAAGWVYLIATHAGTLCLLALFTLWQRAGGAFAWGPFDPHTPPTPALATALFLLSLAGFGFKAGIMPLHIWLPGAHANAPSHVSAVMSGVMLKMGVYGVVRTAGWLPMPQGWWGGLLLGLGAASAVLGIAFAVGQRDIKRMLAYSSIENIGIITIGLGLALSGRFLGRTDMVMLGLGGALLHVWNHSLFKGLLFLNAGAVIHATGTRDIEHLGGLAKRMPATAGLFLLGATAICALPPLNGFASEWLIYLGCFRSLAPDAGAPGWPLAALGIVVLAMAGALAAACFCRAFGVVFLGSPRSDATSAAHDPAPSLLLPMLLLAAGCLAIGLMPLLLAPVLKRAVCAWCVPEEALRPVVMPFIPSLYAIGLLAVAGLILALAVGWLLHVRSRTQPRVLTDTWGCGYTGASPRVQYTGASFGQGVMTLFAWALRPVTRHPGIHAPFPRTRAFSIHLPDTALERLVLPLFNLTARLLLRLRFLQQGRLHIYVFYFPAVVLILLLLGKWGRLYG